MNSPIAASVQILETAENGVYETLCWLSIANAVDLVDSLCDEHGIKREHVDKQTNKGFCEVGNGNLITFTPTWPDEAAAMLELEGYKVPKTENELCQALLTITKDKPRTFNHVQVKLLLSASSAP